MVIGKRLLDDFVKATFEVTGGWLKIEPGDVEPKTITVSGDNTNLALWIMLMVVALIGIGMTVYVYRRKKKSDNQ